MQKIEEEKKIQEVMINLIEIFNNEVFPLDDQKNSEIERNILKFKVIF